MPDPIAYISLDSIPSYKYTLPTSSSFTDVSTVNTGETGKTVRSRNLASARDAGNIPVGVMQVRVGYPSIRSAKSVALVQQLISVGKSDKVGTLLDSAIEVVKSRIEYIPNNSNISWQIIFGNYEGNVDGCFILRAISATEFDVFSPYGYKKTYTVDGNFSSPTFTPPLCQNEGGYEISSGISFSIDWDAGFGIGDTWILPVFSRNAYNSNQTGIVSPFSMFTGAKYSVGGLKTATFTPRVDGLKKLQTGFSSYTADQIIDSVSVDIAWKGYEYTNAQLLELRNMLDRTIHNGEVASIPVECVMATRGGSLVTFWNPSCSINILPSYSPQNDYSDIQFQVTGLKQTEVTINPYVLGLDRMNRTSFEIYNAWLDFTYVYSELMYPH